MSSPDSMSSSAIGGNFDLGWVAVFCVELTGFLSVDVSYAIFAYTFCKNYVHLDGPSMSSRDLRRFLVLSTDVEIVLKSLDHLMINCIPFLKYELVSQFSVKFLICSKLSATTVTLYAFGKIRCWCWCWCLICLICLIYNIYLLLTVYIINPSIAISLPIMCNNFIKTLLESYGTT